MIYLVGLVLVVSLTASLTRLARTDRITAPWRVRLRERHGRFSRFLVDMLECARCTSVWTSPFAVFPALALAVAYLDMPWLAAVLVGIPASKAVAYLAFHLLILEGDDD
jgi:hypothetical protein